MPLRLVPPREGKTPHWYIRGTYLGVRVNRTAGTPERATARKVLALVKADIERGRLAAPREPTFADAALAYLRAGGDGRFLSALTDHFGETRLADIDQAAIDGAAQAIHPDAAPATRNRQVYTPLSAILKHVGIDFALRRPKGAGGLVRTAWLWPEDAARLFAAARAIDAEFACLLILLCYTGMRLGEALALRCGDVRLAESFAYLPTSKTEEPRAVFLPEILVAALAGHPRGLERAGRVFRFRKNGRLYGLMRRTRLRACGLDAVVPAPAAFELDWVTFHTFRHTYATWMRRYGGLDVRGLVGTGAWRSEKSAGRYAHVVVTEEARRAALLPVPKRAGRD